MIKIVAFDLGNVILPFDVLRLATRLADYSPYSPNEIVDKLWNPELADRFETGQMTANEYYEHVCGVCRFTKLPYNEFVPIFNDIFNEDQRIVDIITRLRKTHKLALISNTNEIHVKHIVANYPHLSHFDRLWFSNEAGVRKPDPAIYRMLLDHFGIEPREAVFVDDMEVNVKGAEELGIHGILFRGADDLESKLTRLGVFDAAPEGKA